ncbi:MAG: branched-chain amino acid ABC transporter permease, partial [Acetobacteraceae bacterium]|nr:branched-chain amino acid ABC transporter permease [Acetobacteraceae bacterium]
IITLPAIVLFGVPITGPVGRYLFTLFIVTVLALAAKNLVRSNAGRAWMAIRDMDIAAEIIGIRPLRTKLLAFAVSAFYCGIAGALLAFVYLDSVEPAAFNLERSFQVLFMVIIGGLGSILGCFLGAAFITLLPIFFNRVPTLLGLPLSTATISHVEFMIFGALIVFFLIVEPHGLARLWQIGKEKLRLWPFPH